MLQRKLLIKPCLVMLKQGFKKLLLDFKKLKEGLNKIK